MTRALPADRGRELRADRLLLIPLLLLLVFSPAFAWWDNSWQYRRPITVTNNTGSTLTDFQVKVVVDTASLISEGKMNSDCSDLRFVDSDDTTELPYWIERGCGTSETVVWVKVPEIPAGGKTIYMYYGNPSAVSQSNGDAVFEFFDDFEGTSLDTSKWTAILSPSTSVSNGILTIITDARMEGLRTDIPYSEAAGLSIEMKVKWNSGQWDEFGPTAAHTSNHSYFALTSNFAKNFQIKKYQLSPTIDNTLASTSYSPATGVWKILGLTVVNVGSFKAYLIDDSGEYLTLQASDSEFTDGYIGMGALSGASESHSIDWYRIRKYADPEPTATVGAEESVGGFSVSLSHSPTAAEDLALDPENNVTSITVEYNAVFNKQNVTVIYYRAFDGDTNATILEGTDDVNYITFSRTYDAIGDYNTCVYVKAVDESNNEYEDTACDVVHIDQYPQGVDFDWDVKIPFPDENIQFSGTAADNGAVTYSWDFGDGGTGDGQTVEHAYSAAATYTVTMTVTDDVGLSKSITKDVPVYSVPELNWTPATPHAQEPTTFTIQHDPRLTVANTSWSIEDANIDSATDTNAVARFQHYGSKSVSASFTLTDGTHERNESVSGTVNVDPIHVRVQAYDESTLDPFDVAHTDNNTIVVELYDADGEYFRKDITTTGAAVEWDLNTFPAKIVARYVYSGNPVYRTYIIREHVYELNHAAYLPDLKTTSILAIPFYITDQTGQFSDPVLIIRRLSNNETLEVLSDKKDAEGKVLTYLIPGVEYTLAVWQDGVERSIGVYRPVTAQSVTLTIGGFVLTPEAQFPIVVDVHIDTDTNTLIFGFRSDTPVSASVSVYDIGGQLIYATTFENDVNAEGKLTGIDPSQDYKVVFSFSNGYTVTRWVSATRAVVLGLPGWAYSLIAAAITIGTLLATGAVSAWVGGIAALAWAALFSWMGWINVPTMLLLVLGALIFAGRRGAT